MKLCTDASLQYHLNYYHANIWCRDPMWPCLADQARNPLRDCVTADHFSEKILKSSMATTAKEPGLFGKKTL